jgi:hypothetical protein
LHLYLLLKTPLKTRDMKYFDISDKDSGKNYHPNLQIARKPNDVV